MAQIIPSKVDLLIGKRIQAKRKESGFSAEKLAELLDISQQQLSRYERGNNKISASLLVDLSNIFKTPISYFFIDCFEKSCWNNDSLDLYWHSLTEEQKQLLANFILSFDIPQKPIKRFGIKLDHLKDSNKR